MKLSVVVPVYDERNSIKNIYDRIKAIDLDKEIILLDVSALRCIVKYNLFR